ncbi:hypothetical protein G9C01_01900 [Blattabacterium sp. DPU]|uniref:porin n=1 Tax=Blattabacterium sp. DPU TaxID=2715232 RepID=UPI00140B83F5|nr:porin [Blattabacterium sp. DPU]QIK16693.1 hypothetical protein G9C01_01900 [Blattabacterium sp. DPU]
MKKTKIIFLILFLGFFYSFHSFAKIIKKKKTVEENPHFNIFLDFSSSLNSTVKTVKKEFSEGSRFSEDYLGLEVVGKATDKISYRFVKQFKKTENENTENYGMVDVAYLKYKWNDKLYFLVGKQPFSFGSMEYANSFYDHAYRYTNVYKNKENSVGFSFVYLPIKNHEFQFQIVNGEKKREKNVGVVEEEHHPMGYSLNWNWNFNKIFQNRWSYSIFQENDKKIFWKLLALGSKLNLKPISIEADYILSNENIEKNVKIAKILQSSNQNYCSFPIKYGTYLVKLKYNFFPEWNLIIKGVYEIGTYKKGINNILEKNKLFQKAYTYYGGVEFIPFIKKNDLSFYFSYQNQIINYKLYSMKKENKNNHFIILGFNYRVKMI